MLARMRLGRSRSIVAVLTLGPALAVALVASGLIAPRGSDVALGTTTTLTIISETVELSREGSAFAPAEDGAVLGPRDAIRTGPEGRAVLTYFDGSTVSIEPTTEIVIDRAESGADGSVVIAMTQRLGRSWHVVATLITGGSSYEVRTPATTASVRGTAFEIALVLEADEVVAVVSTTEGEVVAATASTPEAPQPERVVVAAGFQANVKRGAPIERPKPQPEPERRVSVDADAVVDPLGRFNGRTADGRIVLQTPGAKIEGGRIVLPNVPDGKLSTIVHPTKDQPGGDATRTLKTRVEERGKQPVEVEERVRRSSGERTVSGVELKRSDPGKAPEIRKLDDDEKRRLSTGKVGQTPTPRRRAEPPRGKPAGPEDARRTDAPGAGQPIQRPGRVSPQVGPAGQRTPQPARTPAARRTPEVKRQDQQRAPTATPARRTGSATAAPQRRTESPRTQPPARRTGTPTAAPQRRTEPPRTPIATPQRRTEAPQTQPPARP